MMDFLGGAEINVKTEMLGMENRLQQAMLQAKKTEAVKNEKYLDGIKKVSVDFESIFLGYMLKQMRSTVPEDPIFGKSNAKDIYYSMYDESVAKELAKAGGIGLAAILYNQLSQIQQATPAAETPSEIKEIK